MSTKLTRSTGAALAGMLLATGLAASSVPAFADEVPGETLKTKTTLSAVIGPGGKVQVSLGCGGTKSFLKSVGMDAIQRGNLDRDNIAKNVFRADKVRQGQVFNEVTVEFSNSQPKGQPSHKQQTVQLRLTIVCSNVDPGKFPDTVSVENQLRISGAPEWGAKSSGEITTPCPSTHPFYSDSAVTVDDEDGDDLETGIVAYKNVDRSVYPNKATYDILNYNDLTTDVSTFVFCSV